MIRPTRETDDLAPGLTDLEVQQEAQGFWLEEHEELLEERQDEFPARNYEWV